MIACYDSRHIPLFWFKGQEEFNHFKNTILSSHQGEAGEGTLTDEDAHGGAVAGQGHRDHHREDQVVEEGQRQLHLQLSLQIIFCIYRRYDGRFINEYSYPLYFPKSLNLSTHLPHLLKVR